jgi:hypothetical protein
VIVVEMMMLLRYDTESRRVIEFIIYTFLAADAFSVVLEISVHVQQIEGHCHARSCRNLEPLACG